MPLTFFVQRFAASDVSRQKVCYFWRFSFGCAFLLTYEYVIIKLCFVRHFWSLLLPIIVVYRGLLLSMFVDLLLPTFVVFKYFILLICLSSDVCITSYNILLWSFSVSQLNCTEIGDCDVYRSFDWVLYSIYTLSLFYPSHKKYYLQHILQSK